MVQRLQRIFQDVKPPLFDQFYVIVVDDDDTCLKDMFSTMLGHGPKLFSYSKLLIAFVGVIASLVFN